jgi:hypothetical protein
MRRNRIGNVVDSGQFFFLGFTQRRSFFPIVSHASMGVYLPRSLSGGKRKLSKAQECRRRCQIIYKKGSLEPSTISSSTCSLSTSSHNSNQLKKLKSELDPKASTLQHKFKMLSKNNLVVLTFVVAASASLVVDVSKRNGGTTCSQN